MQKAIIRDNAAYLHSSTLQNNWEGYSSKGLRKTQRIRKPRVQLGCAEEQKIQFLQTLEINLKMYLLLAKLKST